MASLISQLVDIDGAILEVFRGGTGRPVVCGSQPHAPDPQGSAWYAEHTEVVYVMPRGHGRSSPVRAPAEMRLSSMIRDQDAVRRVLGIDRWVLEGYSGGSQLALTYALALPDPVAALIVGFSVANMAGALENPGTPLSPAYPGYTAELAAAGLRLDSGPSTDEPRWVELRPDLWSLAQGDRPLLMSPGEEPHPHYRTHLEEVIHYDVSGQLHEIRVPALVVCGRRDPIVAVPELCAEIHQGIPNSELLVLEHSGHGVDAADTDPFRETVLRFLAGLDLERETHE
jgi:proline iminopeptidase